VVNRYEIDIVFANERIAASMSSSAPNKLLSAVSTLCIRCRRHSTEDCDSGRVVGRARRHRCGDSFVREIRCRSHIDNHLEMLLPPDVELAVLKEAKAILGDLPVFWRRHRTGAANHSARRGHNSDEEVATFVTNCARRSDSRCVFQPRRRSPTLL